LRCGGTAAGPDPLPPETRENPSPPLVKAAAAPVWEPVLKPSGALAHTVRTASNLAVCTCIVRLKVRNGMKCVLKFQFFKDAYKRINKTKELIN
jgi:hypothetical protein